MYKAIIAIGVLAAACLIAGCGSSSDETAKAAVTEAQFMKQANEVCEKTQRELQAAVKEGKTDVYEQVSSLLSQEAEELEAIAGSDSVESRVEPLIETITMVSGIIAGEKQDGFEDPRIAAYKREAKKLNLRTC